VSNSDIIDAVQPEEAWFLAGLILAGGQSRRYGQDKAFAKLLGRPLIDYVIDALAPAAGRLFIVAGSAEPFAAYSKRLSVLTDEVPGLGPLGGLYAGLKASPDEYCATAPCDSPFIDSSLVAHMLQKAATDGVDALIPRYSGYTHTAHAVYAKACLAAIESSLGDGLFRLDSIFDRVRVQYVDDDTINMFPGGALSFFNVNTPDDMAEAVRILKERGGLDG
jgi:molybdopterin-guanine dinucleotide biosynthesis protein A